MECNGRFLFVVEIVSRLVFCLQSSVGRAPCMCVQTALEAKLERASARMEFNMPRSSTSTLTTSRTETAEIEQDMGDTNMNDVVTPVLHLPRHIIDEIVNRLGDARAIAVAETVCKDFFHAGRQVTSIRLVCEIEHYDRARGLEEWEPSAEDFNAMTERMIGQTGGTGGACTSGSSQVFRNETLFRDLAMQIVKQKPNLTQLRLEIEPKLQSKVVSEEERRRTDFWLSDPHYLKKWIPDVSRTLQHLCIVDYGEQAIVRRTNILKILSNTCEYFLTPDA